MEDAEARSERGSEAPRWRGWIDVVLKWWCGRSLRGGKRRGRTNLLWDLTAFEAPLGLADGRRPGAVGVELEEQVQVGQADVGVVSIRIITVFLKADELGQVSCVDWGGRGRAIFCCGLTLLLQTSYLWHFLLEHDDASLFTEVRAAVAIWPSGLFSYLRF